MKKNLRIVGLDVHKDSIAVAVAESGREPARLLETIAHDEVALLRVLDRLGPKARLRVCSILFGPNYAATLHSRSGDDLFFFFLKLVLRHAPILRILLWYWRFSNTVAITARCQSQRGEEVHCGSRTSRG